MIGTKAAGNSFVRLETLPGQEGSYPETMLLFHGNTCYGDPEENVACEEGRICRGVTNGNCLLAYTADRQDL